MRRATEQDSLVAPSAGHAARQRTKVGTCAGHLARIADAVPRKPLLQQPMLNRLEPSSAPQQHHCDVLVSRS